MLKRRDIFTDDHEMFRDSVRKFLERDCRPYREAWRHDGMVPKDFWRKAGAAGLLCPSMPEDYGCPGGDFRYNCVVDEEMAYGGAAAGFSVHSDIVAPYLLHY